MHTGEEAHSANDYFNGLKHSLWTGLEFAAIQFSIENRLWAIVSHIKLKIKKDSNLQDKRGIITFAKQLVEKTRARRKELE